MFELVVFTCDKSRQPSTWTQLSKSSANDNARWTAQLKRACRGPHQIACRELMLTFQRKRGTTSWYAVCQMEVIYSRRWRLWSSKWQVKASQKMGSRCSSYPNFNNLKLHIRGYLTTHILADCWWTISAGSLVRLVSHHHGHFTGFVLATHFTVFNKSSNILWI